VCFGETMGIWVHCGSSLNNNDLFRIIRLDSILRPTSLATQEVSKQASKQQIKNTPIFVGFSYITVRIS
jgi:hypothetical protein